MTGVAPSEYLDDPLLYAALRDEAESASWTGLHELLALNVEMTNAVLRQSMINAGIKPADLPKQVRIPRPDDPPPLRLGAVDAARAIMRGG